MILQATELKWTNTSVTLDSQGKYSEAESMYRQTLATSEKVLGVDRPDTLTSVYYLTHLLASQYRHDESTMLYKRACAGYSTTLGRIIKLPVHATNTMPRCLLCMSQPRDPPRVPPDIAPESASRQRANRSELLRRFAKLRLRHSKENILYRRYYILRSIAMSGYRKNEVVSCPTTTVSRATNK